MKRIIRTIAALLAVALIASFGAMSAFAETSGADTMTDEELAELLAMLEEQGYATSGTDASGSDILAETPATFGQLELVEQSFSEYGVKFLAPALDVYGNVYSDVDQLYDIFGDTVAANALFDISYSGFTNYIYYGTTTDGSSMMAMTYTESNWSRFIGSYADLSAEEQLRIEEGSDLIGIGDGSTATFRIINGTPILCQEYYDATYMSKYYIAQAIVDGGVYELYIQLTSPTDADMDVADQIINSLKISGFDVQRYGVASITTTGWLIAIVAILFVVVALMAFFLVRFSLYAKAAGSSFNIIGFDLPSDDTAADGNDEDYSEDDEDDDQSDED